MTNVCTRQSAPSHDSVSWSSRPTSFNKQPAHSVGECQQTSNHCGIANTKSVRILTGNLETCSGAICLTSQGRERRNKPLNSGSSKQIIRISQRQILSQLGAACGSRTSFCFCQCRHPGFVEFTHRIPPSRR